MSENQTNTLTVQGTEEQQSVSIYSSMKTFADAQRIATSIAESKMVPTDYQKNVPNVLIALEMAQRMKVSPLAVMQNLDIIQGRPSFNSKFLIAVLNTCGRFTPLRFRERSLGKKKVSYSYWEGPQGQRQKKVADLEIDNLECIAYATDKETGDVLESIPVTIEMSVIEGWYTKNDSKWKSMPQLMLRYRSATFFQRLYAPELSMGMHTSDELHDIQAEPISQAAPVETSAEKIEQAAAKNSRRRPSGKAKDAPNIEDAQIISEEQQQHGEDQSGTEEPWV